MLFNPLSRLSPKRMSPIACERALIVDDNRHYAKLLADFLIKRNYEVELASSALEGLRLIERRGENFYPVIIFDVTMEKRLSGLSILWRIGKRKNKGTLIMVSTGFNVMVVRFLSRLLLGFLGLHYIIPKTSLLKGKPLFYSVFYFKSHNTSKEKDYSSSQRKHKRSKGLAAQAT